MAPSPTIRRLLKETQELSAVAKHPNPTFHAAPLSEDNLHEWHFTLLGPPSPSPYAGGIYHGRITLPPAYPMKPPNFRFLTPSGRFEVNREICLSISGFHEETWQPAWGVRLALTALRSFMGEEGTAGQVGGLESPKEVRERLARESKHWKCSGCGGEDHDDNRKGLSNEDRMKWWWSVCRGKGVNVEAEVEGLESLPEDMKLEARDVKQVEDEPKDLNRNTEPLRITDLRSESRVVPAPGPTASGHTQNRISGHVHQPVVESTDAHANASLSSIHDRTAGLPNEVVPNSSQQPPVPVNRDQQVLRADSPITIDRAITVIFLALIIMVLKKMIYRGTSSPFFGGYDDLRMMRE